jgi:hypothetical protein
LSTPAKKSKDDLIADAKAFAEKKARETGKDYTSCLEAEMAKLSTHAEFKE